MTWKNGGGERSRWNSSALPLVFLCWQLPCGFQILVDEFVLCGWQTRLIPAVLHGVLPLSLETITGIKAFLFGLPDTTKETEAQQKKDKIVESVQVLIQKVTSVEERSSVA